MPKRGQDIPEIYTQHLQALAHAIGSRVRERRLQLGLTQENVRVKVELENVYITRTKYSRLEKGERIPLASEAIALAKVLNVSLDWLLLGDKETFY